MSSVLIGTMASSTGGCQKKRTWDFVSSIDRHSNKKCFNGMAMIFGGESNARVGARPSVVGKGKVGEVNLGTDKANISRGKVVNIKSDDDFDMWSKKIVYRSRFTSSMFERVLRSAPTSEKQSEDNVIDRTGE